MVTPTPYQEVNVLVAEVLDGAIAILGQQFIGLYLQGSLANGGFDHDSDIDIIVVTLAGLAGKTFNELDAMHMRIAALGSWYAVQLEVSYIPEKALRRFDPDDISHPHIDRGPGERLRIMKHEQDWVIQRHILREKGIRVAGPPIKTLVDPVSPHELRAAALVILQLWSGLLFAEPAQLDYRGYQSFYVLSICRILYTLQFGKVASKQITAGWARATLGPRWVALIDRAWTGRQKPGAESGPDDIIGTLDFMRYALERSHNIGRRDVA
jgi:predicted nucleotidyltransferase